MVRSRTGLGSPAPVAPCLPAYRGPMQRWEYLQKVIPGNVASKASLDELGAQGWELVSVFMRYSAGWETIFYFKRPVVGVTSG